MRLVWTTDPHLNHVSPQRLDRWVAEIASHGADGVVITGDISEGDDVVFQLRRLADSWSCPIYFVLGNHDFYGSSVAVTRQAVITASRQYQPLTYLSDCDPIELEQDAFLLGDDGWGDATVGDYENSTIRLNDFALIEDFRFTDPSRWKSQLQQLGAESADRIGAKLDGLPVNTRHVLIATHVPPYRESCWYQGKTTDDNWAPFFVCGAVGNRIRAAAQARPETQFVVLCGHTHHEGVAQLLPNLVVRTGAAEYGQPNMEGIVEVRSGKCEVRGER